MKRIRKNLVYVLFVMSFILGSSLSVYADSNDIITFATKSKTVSEVVTKSVYIEEGNCYATISYKVTGYYTYDIVSGAIKSAYKCTVTDATLVTPPPSADFESWDVSLNTVSTDMNVYNDGAYARFTANVSCVLEYCPGTPSQMKVYTPNTITTLTAYAS